MKQQKKSKVNVLCVVLDDRILQNPLQIKYFTNLMVEDCLDKWWNTVRARQLALYRVGRGGRGSVLAGRI